MPAFHFHMSADTTMRVDCGFVRNETIEAYAARLARVRDIVARLRAVSPWRHAPRSAVMAEIERLARVVDSHLAALNGSFALTVPPTLWADFCSEARLRSVGSIDRRRNEAAGDDHVRAQQLARELWALLG